MEHNKRSLIDANLNETDAALPNGAASTYSAQIDLEAVSPVHAGESFELVVTVPDLTTTHLPDTRTLTVAVVNDATATPTTVIATLATYTGADGAGATGSTVRYRLPSTAARYVRVKFTGGTSAGDMSAVDAVVGLRF